MAYIRIGDDSFPGGSLGCGPGCPCGPCRSAAARLGQWSVREEAETLEPARTAGWTLSALPYQNPPNLSYQRETALGREGTMQERLGLLSQTPKLRQHGDFVIIENQWCPELRKIQSDTCVSYEPTEVRISHTEPGHLTPDVVLVPPGLPGPNVVFSCRYLVIRDFGVDWRHVKLAPRNEQLFKDWLNRFETDKSLFFRIVGYSDCVGFERNNLLRRGRARNVFRLLGSNARSRVTAVIAAPPRTYLTDNSTIAARANNRSVVIEFFVNTSQII